MRTLIQRTPYPVNPKYFPVLNPSSRGQVLHPPPDTISCALQPISRTIPHSCTLEHWQAHLEPGKRKPGTILEGFADRSLCHAAHITRHSPRLIVRYRPVGMYLRWPFALHLASHPRAGLVSQTDHTRNLFHPAKNSGPYMRPEQVTMLHAA
jgi:hypothetical protein